VSVRLLGLLAPVVLAALLAGCGGSSDPRLTVFAASSLSDVLPRIDTSPRYSFAGSNTLAAQIRQGAPADVFAAASPKLPDELHAAGLVGKPVVFAHNALVLIVPRANRAGIGGVGDLDRRGVKLVVAAAGVPAGDYTREVLAKLGKSDLVARAVSQESDVREVLSKVALGEADAGFVYATDAKAAGRKVKAIALPARAQPRVASEVAVVAGGDEQAARDFVDELRGERGQSALRAAGFLP
jgi:molybdate transport system substrate-binding protein